MCIKLLFLYPIREGLLYQPFWAYSPQDSALQVEKNPQTKESLAQRGVSIISFQQGWYQAHLPINVHS